MDINERLVNIIKNKKNSGTGFYFSDNLIFTCAHVCTPNSKPGQHIYFTDCRMSDQYEAEIMYLDTEDDIAILKTKKTAKQFFTITEYNYNGGNIECSSKGFIGNDQGIDLESRDMKLVVKSERIDRYQLNNANSIAAGFSGAPVWDSCNTLIGMVCVITRTENGRLTDHAFMIGNENLIKAINNWKQKASEVAINAFDEVMRFDSENHMVYTTLVKKIRDGEIIVPLVGNSLSEYIFGRKEALITQLCHLLFPDTDSLENIEKKKALNKGELGLSIDFLLHTSTTYKNILIEFFKDIYNSCYINDFQSEEEVISLIPYMQYAIRFMPDGLLENIAHRRRLAVNASYNGNNQLRHQENSFEIYSLCGDLESNILYSLTDYTENKEACYEKLVEWLGMKSILFVGVCFDKNTLDLCKKICNDNNIHYAFVSCKNDPNIKSDLRKQLDQLNISCILYDQNDSLALEQMLHKLLIDTRNEQFVRRFNRLDYRFSQQTLSGRSEEVNVLQSFLDSEWDYDNDLPFLWLNLYGEVGSGKSKLINDFSKKNSNEWQLIWVDCDCVEQFLNEAYEFINHLNKSAGKNILLVFDDFYLHPFKFEYCKDLIRYKGSKKLRIIFVTDSEKCPFTDKDYKKYSVLQFERSPLYVRQLPKEAVVEICINYANYLKNSVLENLFQTDHLDDFSELKKVINKTYEHCVCNKEPFSLYICLIRTLQWLNLLGTNDSYYSDKSILMQYMFREKLKDDADKKKNIWNLNKYTQEFVSWDKNKKNLELGNDNDFVRDV